MKAKITTGGFFFMDDAGQFGVTGQEFWQKDSYKLLGDGLEITTWSGCYKFKTAHLVGGYIFVPPQSGEYTGPYEGLGGIYGLGFNITHVGGIVIQISKR